jgi:hypothetical protein
MHAATGADVVYHKDYDHGVLYTLFFKHDNRKQHSTVENSVQKLDSMLMTKNNTTRTNFTSLTSAEPGKVKSFSGRDRQEDFHFCEIFDVNAPKLNGGKEYQRKDGVSVWSQALNPQEEDGYSDMVQKLVSDRETLTEDHDESVQITADKEKDQEISQLKHEVTQLTKKIKEIESYRANVGLKDKEIEQLKTKLQNNETSLRRMDEQVC